jgi:hypothetical protein
MDTKCTAPSLIPTVNGNTVRSFSTHGHLSASQGSSTTVSHSDIRLTQHLDSSAHGLVRRRRLIGYSPRVYSPHPLITPATVLLSCLQSHAPRDSVSPDAPVSQAHEKTREAGGEERDIKMESVELLLALSRPSARAEWVAGGAGGFPWATHDDVLVVPKRRRTIKLSAPNLVNSTCS